MCLLSNLNSIFLDFGMQLLKMNTVKQHGNHHSGTGEMLNNNQVELSENYLILLFYEFLKCVY